MAVKVKKTLRSRIHWKLLTVAVVLAAVVVVGALELTGTTHFFRKSDAATKVVVKAGKPTPVPVNNVSKGTTTAAKTPATSAAASTPGGGKDTNGSVSASTSPGQWVVSQSGNITVKQPVANAALQSGAVLSGSAKVGTVNFRLIDSKVGVISEGTLNVVNGNFSGVLSFTSQSSTGRLDVFSTDTPGGPELNEVQISVGF